MKTLCTLALLTLPALALAAPIQLSHSGRVLDSFGEPVEGAHELRLSIHNAATDGAEVWGEDISVTLVDGYYSVVLGADTVGNALEYSDWSATGGWVQVSDVLPGPTVVPLGGRQALLYVPHAAYAAEAGGAQTALLAVSATTADSALVADALSGTELADLAAADFSMGNLAVNGCFNQGFEHWALVSGAGSVVQESNSRCGQHVFQNDANSVAWITSAELVPVNRSGTYEVFGSFRATDPGSVGNVFLAVSLYDDAGSLINGDGSFWYYPVSNLSVTSSVWASFSAEFGLTTNRPFPSNATYMRVGAIVNYDSGGAAGDRIHQTTGLGIRQLPSRSNAWADAILLNGWVPYANGYPSAGYTRDSSGVLHLRGIIKSGTVGASAPAFTLPVGYRPTSSGVYNCMGSGDTLARCDVHPNGLVYIVAGAPAWIALDGISFPTW